MHNTVHLRKPFLGRGTRPLSRNDALFSNGTEKYPGTPGRDCASASAGRTRLR